VAKGCVSAAAGLYHGHTGWQVRGERLRRDTRDGTHLVRAHEVHEIHEVHEVRKVLSVNAHSDRLQVDTLCGRLCGDGLRGGTREPTLFKQPRDQSCDLKQSHQQSLWQLPCHPGCKCSLGVKHNFAAGSACQCAFKGFWWSLDGPSDGGDTVVALPCRQLEALPCAMLGIKPRQRGRWLSRTRF